MNKPELKAKADALQVELDGLKKLLEEKQGPWMPESGKHYWVLLNNGTAHQFKNNSQKITDEHFAIGNGFQTESQAQAESDRRKLKVRILNTIAELNDGWEPDWSDIDEDKFYFSFVLENGRDEPVVILRHRQACTSQAVNSNLVMRSEPARIQLQAQYTPEELTAAYWA